MKKSTYIVTIAVSLFSIAQLAAQKPLSYYAFQKMMRNHYSFTVLGTQAPVSGFKVETNKPTITLKGNIYSGIKQSDDIKKKALIINLELTGGVSNEMQQIFAGDKLNGYFKAALGFNLLFDGGNNAKYTMSNDFEKMLNRKKVVEYHEEVALQVDSMLALSALEDILNAPVQTLDKTVEYMLVLAGKDEYTINNYSDPAKWRRPFPYSDLPGRYKSLVIAMIKKYGADVSIADEDAMFIDFIAKLRAPANNTLKYSKLVSDFGKAAKFKQDRRYKYQLIDDQAIDTYKNIWTQKKITWLNVSVSGLNSSFKMYNAGTNMLSDSNSFIPALTLSYNLFTKYAVANKYFLFRIGIGVKRMNSLADLPKFDYKKETLINVSPTETLKSEKSGTAYQGELKHGFGFELPLETYWAPWTRDAIPGLYGKLQYNYGETWINKNKISMDIGMIWNLTNSDKDSKSVVTIVPYVSWANLVKEYKDVQKTKQKSLSDLFSVGLKFGIPVNLGK